MQETGGCQISLVQIHRLCFHDHRHLQETNPLATYICSLIRARQVLGANINYALASHLYAAIRKTYGPTLRPVTPDHMPIGAYSRSTPASYTGTFNSLKRSLQRSRNNDLRICKVCPWFSFSLLYALITYSRPLNSAST
jgi:hypothetical protein